MPEPDVAGARGPLPRVDCPTVQPTSSREVSMRAFIAFIGIVIVLIAFATFFILEEKGVDLL